MANSGLQNLCSYKASHGTKTVGGFFFLLKFKLCISINLYNFRFDNFPIEAEENSTWMTNVLTWKKYVLKKNKKFIYVWAQVSYYTSLKVAPGDLEILYRP